MQAIFQVQHRLYTLSPPNYGILTGLLTYLLQSVLYTPTMVSSYVNESLALLRFREVVDRFGMFFLHDLDLSREVCLPAVLRADDLGVLKALGVKLVKKKTHRSLDSDVPTEAYPLGEAPSWADVESCIRDQPWTLMRPWLWSDNLGLLNQAACQLFKQFTTHIWTCLNARWCTNEDPIRPESLHDAIESWTLTKVHARIKSVSFIACNATLLGNIPGRRVLSFAERRALYFPASSDDLVGYWKLLSTRPGYIAEYQEICADLTEDEISDLDSDLGTLLSQCQCLPLSIRVTEIGSNAQQVIWKVQKQDILVLTNPSFYKLVRVSGTSRHSSTRAPPAHAPKKSLQVSLLEQSGVSRNVARKAVNWSRTLQKEAHEKTRRSGKAKNRRVPPQRKKVPVPPEHESGGDDDGDEDDDEDGENEEADNEEGASDLDSGDDNGDEIYV